MEGFDSKYAKRAGGVPVGETEIDPVKLFAERYMQKPWRFPDKYVESPTLTVFMLARDDEDVIGRCLKSLRGVADQIIVIDGGSADRTAEIANEHGAKVLRHDISDPNLALNACLDNAAGDWVMVVDPNEELLAEDAPIVRELLEEGSHEGFYLNEHNVLDEPDGDIAINLSFRLWRNKPERRFSGPLREQIRETVRSDDKKVGLSAVRINRYLEAPLTPRRAGGAAREADILLTQSEGDPENPYITCNLGVAYLRCGEFEDALESFKRAFANLSGLNPSYASKLVRNIAVCLKVLGRSEEAFRVLADAREAYPDYIDLVFLEGMLYLEQNDYPAAIQSFKASMAPALPGAAYASQAGVDGPLAARMTGRAHLAAGDVKEALASYQRALECDPGDAAGLLEIAMLLIDRENPESLRQYLESLADTTSEEVLFTLALIFTESGRHEVALEYLDRMTGAGISPSQYALARGECLLSLGRYGESLAELGRISSSSARYWPGRTARVVCLLLAGDFAEAAVALDELSSRDELALVSKVYRQLWGLLSGEAVISTVEPQEKAEARALITRILRMLLELRELAAFEKAAGLPGLLELWPGEISLFLGKVYYEAGMNEAAVEELIKAHESGCADGETFFILGRAALDNEFYEESATFFYEALQRGIEDLALYISLARALMKLRETGRAMEVLGMAAERYPGSSIIEEMKQSIEAIV